MCFYSYQRFGLNHRTWLVCDVEEWGRDVSVAALTDYVSIMTLPLSTSCLGKDMKFKAETLASIKAHLKLYIISTTLTDNLQNYQASSTFFVLF